MIVILLNHLGGNLRGYGAGHIFAIAVAVFRPGEDTMLIGQVVFNLRMRVVGKAQKVVAQIGHRIEVGLEIFGRNG